MQRFRQTRALHKFASAHTGVHKHFNIKRDLIERQTYEERRSAALAEWQILAS